MPDPKITPRENGPFIATDIPDLTLADGTTAEPKPLAPLCRCGASKNKPYCDGAHNEIGFDSAPNPDAQKRDRIYRYAGEEVTVHFNKLLCSHAGECGKRARNIFNTKEQPWVQPDKGTLEEIKEVVANCPSGALRYSQSGGAQTITNDAVAIVVEPNGPYHVRNIPVEAEYWAEGQSEEKYVLCRCGLSKNKPFCDGTHYDEKWRSDD